MSTLAINKKASFDYEVLEKFEAGLVLFGHEVKSIRAGQASLKGSYISFRGSLKSHPSPYLVGTHVPLYKMAGKLESYNPDRDRELLLKKKELNYLVGKKQMAGLTLIPLRLYTNHSFIKLEFALARGRKKQDKREVIKKREVDRNLRTIMKQIRN